ncbi:MAG: clostripain-related cysteine peptidase [Candidatus Electronema sp. V4]|uniref:clostripain-related cysteine peptidase n=1 Tax=Candidatus Electronema sp. V4 TaxID=3454756 RepID=UPI00405572DE
MDDIKSFNVTKTNPAYAIILIVGGDNDLNGYIEKDMQEMLAGMSGNMSVLCLADYLDKPAEVVELTKAEGIKLIESSDEWGELNTGDPEKLAEFLTRALITYNADTKIAIGFWSHGSGIFDATVPQSSSIMTELPDMMPIVASEEQPMASDIMLDLANNDQPVATDIIIEVVNEDSSIGTEWPDMVLNVASEEQPQPCDMAVDFTNKDILTNKEAGKMLELAFNKAGFSDRKVNMIFSDTCLNGMVELLHEFAKYADVIVASEDLEPGDGWDYKLWFEKMAAEPPIDSVSWAKQAVAAFEESYKNKTDFHPCTLGAFAADNILVQAFKELIEAVDTHGKKGWYWMRDARERTQRFDVLATYDLFHFTQNLTIILAEYGINADAVRAKSAGLASALQSCRVHSVALGDKVRDSHGLSFWFPYERALFEKEIATYSALSFDAYTGWTEYLKKYYR